MPLLALWNSNQSAVGEFSIEQVVSTAGDGILKDGSICSAELREYLAQIRAEKIGSYIEHCLGSSFTKGGMVLQDLINELGRWLDYEVTNGRYQGISSAIGFDGLWRSPEGHSIIAEVKTTDAYRISLETIAQYRSKLSASGQLGHRSSILIIVGRQDTGELEAQVRGSRHAWDVRLISAEALIRLVQLKQNSDASETGRKIRSLLEPMEYTRLDKLIDVMFTAATDVSTELVPEEIGEESGEAEAGVGGPEKSGYQFTNSVQLQNKREQIIAALGRSQKATLIQRSRALYWDAAHQVRAACSISKHYDKRSYPYWYAYHPTWDEFLSEGTPSFFVLGCMDLDFAFATPREVLRPYLESLNTTTTQDDYTYWHIHLVEKAGSYALMLPKRSSSLPLDEYRIKLGN
ncbi:MAG: hypothetical protein JOZ16_02760 [Methylobacteriaceae bacterium]|nr:hypothetical protein [Methylobacteriaceae bacterium]